MRASVDSLVVCARSLVVCAFVEVNGAPSRGDDREVTVDAENRLVFHG